MVSVETVPPDAECERGVAAMIVDLRLSGIVQVQFLRTPDGVTHVMDLNPRCYASIGLAITAGANLPATAVDLLLGRTPVVRPYRTGVRYRVEATDLLALLDEAPRGDVRGALAGLVPHRGTVHATFSLRDPRPVLTIGAKARRRLLGAFRSDDVLQRPSGPTPTRSEAAERHV